MQGNASTDRGVAGQGVRQGRLEALSSRPNKPFP